MRFLSRSTITARQFSFIYKKCPGFRRGYFISNECVISSYVFPGNESLPVYACMIRH